MRGLLTRSRVAGALAVLGLLAVAGGTFAVWRCPASLTTCARVVYHRAVSGTEYPTDVVWTGDGEVEFYGAQYVPESDYDTVTGLGVDAVLLDFPIGDDPSVWLATLDAADDAGLSVVAWLWTPGWELVPGTDEWVFDDRALTFLDTVADHPALFAVYATHEAYWNDCFDCGYTTAELQGLYRQIKEQADVPVYSSFSGYTFWAEMGAETTFADGVCDYCDTWYYPVLDDGTYDRDGFVERLESELAAFRVLAPNSKFVWVLQGFGSDEWERSRPTAAQLADMAEIASTADIDGVWWYPWTFDPDEYDSVLEDSPDLQEVVGRSARLYGRTGAR